jgi:hypothetical protein
MENEVEEKGFKDSVREHYSSIMVGIFVLVQILIKEPSVSVLPTYFEGQGYYLFWAIVLNLGLLGQMLDFPFFQQIKFRLKYILFFNLFIIGLFFLIEFIGKFASIVPLWVLNVFLITFWIGGILFIIGYCFHIVQKYTEKH